MSDQTAPAALINSVPDNGGGNICKNCQWWRDKAWTDKGWGICDNPKNEVKAGPLSMIRYYLKDDPKAAEELAAHVEDGIRYPEDFGCIFFEAWKAS